MLQDLIDLICGVAVSQDDSDSEILAAINDSLAGESTGFDGMPHHLSIIYHRLPLRGDRFIIIDGIRPPEQKDPLQILPTELLLASS